MSRSRVVRVGVLAARDLDDAEQKVTAGVDDGVAGEEVEEPLERGPGGEPLGMSLRQRALRSSVEYHPT